MNIKFYPFIKWARLLREIIFRILGNYGFIRLNYKKILPFLYFKELYDLIEKVEGDIVECGVAYGDSLLILGALAKQENKGRIVYGFDSFNGFPEPTGEDASFRNAKKGEYKDATLQKTKNLFRYANISQATLVKGFVEDTLPGFDGTIAFLHIDLDLYSAYKATLENLFYKVSRGGIIVFDEYSDPKFPGAKKAVDEFFQDKGYVLHKTKYQLKGLDKFYVVKK